MLVYYVLVVGENIRVVGLCILVILREGVPVRRGICLSLVVKLLVHWFD